ncbi:MAG TPA: (Fe-S)-binding protein [Polyangia bacterium]|jgi:Fe-S oxidoreductase|nr:(Fe-S)-binding protein [Polyangia bacterium]
MKRVIFTVVLLGALAFFAWTVRRFARLILGGRPDVRTDHPGDRVASVMTYFFGQKKVVEKTVIPAARAKRLVSAIGSKYHFLIFWGFIIITVGTGETLLQGIFPSFALTDLLGPTLGRFLYATIDVSNVLVLATIVFAVFRRVVLKPRLIPMSRDAAAILGAIALLMITHYGIHGLRAAAGAGQAGFPLSNAIGDALAGLSAPTAMAWSEVCWWLHVVVVLAFLNYLLYSKHSHIIAALPNIYFRKLGQRGILPKLNMEADDMAATGVVSEYKDFTWKSLLDGYACTECARCSNFCPAYNTGKPLSPMQVIHDVRDDMKSRMPDKGPLDHIISRFQHARVEADELDRVIPLIGGRTTEDVLWACTSCGACQEVCPVFIDHPEKILQMRQNLVLVQEKVPTDLARTFTNLERNGNPWGLGADKRMDWADGKNVPTLDDKPDAEYLLWVGCAGAYDDRIKKQTLALVDILREGGVDFAVLGLEEGCSGDPARRAGNEMLYQMQAQQNVETMNAKKVKKVITACPHCLHTIKNEYPQLGGTFEVRHHTQVIRELMAGGKVEIDQQKAGGKTVALHDPCYLGRWNGEYDAPRDVLDGLPGTRIELPRNKQHGFCCGAGGGRMWMEEKIGTRVNHNRVDEVIASGADTVATACPFCTIMLRDGVQDRDAGEKVAVVNVSELVAKTMKRKKEIEATAAAAPPEST